MQSYAAFVAALNAHAVLFGFIAAGYILAATTLNKTLWPKPASPPASKWLVRLHFVVIDWISLQASKGAFAKGAVLHLGPLQITIPFASWSELLQEVDEMAADHPDNAVTGEQRRVQ